MRTEGCKPDKISRQIKPPTTVFTMGRILVLVPLTFSAISVLAGLELRCDFVIDNCCFKIGNSPCAPKIGTGQFSS